MSTDSSTGVPSSTGDGSTGDASTGGSTGFVGWGDDWRGRIVADAGSTDPEKELKRLERFENPGQVFKSFRQFEHKLSAGELRAQLPKGASPEEIARWRSDNGIPAKSEDYVITMPDGKDPPAEDDAFLKAFKEEAHKNNYSQAHFDAAVSVFYSEVERQQGLLSEADEKAYQETEDRLRQEWGQDYRVNKAMAEALLSRAPQGFRDRFMNGRLDDGLKISNSVEAWKWLVQMEREINPASTVLPGNTGDLGKAISVEKAELETMMRDNNGPYWKGPKSDELQARYRELVDAEAKIKSKSAA